MTRLPYVMKPAEDVGWPAQEGIGRQAVASRESGGS